MVQEQKRLNIRLPLYTLGEEIFHAISHGIGAALSVVALALMVAKARGPLAQISVSFFGTTMILLYTVSCVYHSLSRRLEGKKVMRVIDHCDIYFLIAGTYTPILLCAIRPLNPALAWSIFGVEWALTAIAVTLNAIDLKRFEKISMVCYIGMGWCVIAVLKLTIDAMTMPGFLLLLAGGIAYTIGAVLYGIGKKVRYMHSVFHVLVLAGSVLQFLAILLYVM